MNAEAKPSYMRGQRRGFTRIENRNSGGYQSQAQVRNEGDETVQKAEHESLT